MDGTQRYLLKIIRGMNGDPSVEEIAAASGVPAYIVRRALADIVQKRMRQAK